MARGRRVSQLTWLLGAWLLAAMPAWAEDPPALVTPVVAKPLMVDLISSSQVGSIRLSPDGKHLAGVAYSAWTPVILIVDAETLATRRLPIPPAPSSRFEWRRAIDVHWGGDDILVLDFDSLESESVDLHGKRLARLGERFLGRVASDGPLAGQSLVFRDLKDGDVDVVDVRTGDKRAYRIGLPGTPTHWTFDDQGRLRVVTMRDTAFWSDRTRISNWYRADDTSPWQKLQDVSINEDYWTAARVLPEPNQLAIWSREGRDTTALFRYDTVTRQQISLMAGHPTDDIVLASGLGGPAVRSVVTHGLKPERYWFDADWAHLQASVDAALPDRVNLLSGKVRGRVLVASYSDIDPGRWFLLDAPTMSMREVVAANLHIDPALQRPMQTLRYRARDGLEIPAYLTRPAGPGTAPAPMVVLIHGGPYSRDTWSWDADVQILAAQGYVVFQPQFRGSSGFGRRFEEAGYGQWGLAMQDDITDGVREMVRQGIADPSRVCIYGASYGGYAALWGAIKTPELYRCAASLAGVSDLEEWVSGSLFDDSNAVAREIKRARIGDPSTQREQLARVSPLKHAAEARIPIFIAHGEEDTRVLVSQSKKMVAALRAAGKSVEWLALPNEGHGLYDTDNKARYYAALLSFLQRHIGTYN